MPVRAVVGILSDTHGELDPAIDRVFSGVDHIIHAGDIGDTDILERLELIAPLTAVQGNTDRGWLPWLETTERAQVAGCRIRVVHDLGDAGGRIPAETDVVVSGHTHIARIDERAGVLFVNPGSASDPRGDLGPSVALLEIDEHGIVARIIEL